MKIALSPRRLSRWLLGIAVGLSAVSFLMGLFGDLTGHGRLLGFGRMFNVAAEANIPTWYSSSILLLCAVLFGLIAVGKKSEGDRLARHWQILSLAVLFMAVDEASAIHETMGNVMLRMHLPSVLMHLGWVIPASICVGAFALAYVPFVLRLPGDTRRLFLTAGVVYVSGAFGLEAIGGEWRTAYGAGGPFFRLMETLEEFLEMAGVVILTYVLMKYISVHMHGVAIRIGEEAESHPSSAPDKTDLVAASYDTPDR